MVKSMTRENALEYWEIAQVDSVSLTYAYPKLQT